MSRKIFNSIISILLVVSAIACNNSNNPVTNRIETLVYERNGIIESLGGDCSAVQVRTSSFGNLDFTNISKVKFNFNGSSDADLSSIVIYYIENNNNINLVDLSDRDQINNTRSVEINSPDYNGEIFLRVTLKSSVCTGQIFHLEIRDLKIYTIQ